MTRFRAFLIAVLVAATIHASVGLSFATKTPEKSVVALQAVAPNAEGFPVLKNFCTATSISESGHLWLTAAHCVAPVKDEAGQEWDFPRYIMGDLVFPVVVSVEKDLAVVYTLHASAPALKVAKKAPKHFDKLVVWGHPFGYGTVFPFIGYVSVLEWLELGNEKPYMVYHLTGAPGNSGSAVLNSRNEIISVLQIGWGRSFSPVTGGATFEELTRFLAQVGL